MPSDDRQPSAPVTPPPAAITGRYSDGRTAAVRSVAITFAPDGLHLTGSDTGERTVWPYPSLSTAQPLSARNADALLRSSTEAGATVFVADAGFATQLIGHAPHLTARAERMRYLKPALAVVAVVAAVSGLVWALDWSPARGIARLVPERTWNAAGGQLASTFEKDYPGCEDLPGKVALDKLVQRLVAASPENRSIYLHVVNWGLVNAFALPGRHLMLTRGILRDAASPEEIAGVLGHEMGHALELHPEAGIVRQLGLTVGLKLVFAGTADGLQSLGGLLLLLRYTREGERQADLRAFELLKNAKISAKPLGGFFERMAKKEGDSPVSGKLGKAADLFSSHPALAERAKNARAQPDYPTEPIMSASEWQALRAICKTPPKKTDGKPSAGSGTEGGAAKGGKKPAPDPDDE